jgi:hypothetical protein
MMVEYDNGGMLSKPLIPLKRRGNQEFICHDVYLHRASSQFSSSDERLKRINHATGFKLEVE